MTAAQADADAARAELARQSALLAALWPVAAGQAPGEALPAALAARVRGDAGVAAARGLQAYRINALAGAARALGAVYPVLAALVGDESFAALASAYWLAHPPARGDLAWAGEALPAFVARDPQLADVPYLADVARLEWAVARAEVAADAPDGLASLQRLADTDPSRLRLRLAPGAALLGSAWPVASLWQAHPRAQAGGAAAPDAEGLARVRERLAAPADAQHGQGAGEHAFVWRDGWRVRVEAVEAATAAFLAALVEDIPLGPALEQVARHDPDWPFDAWLVRALREHWLTGADVDAEPG